MRAHISFKVLSRLVCVLELNLLTSFIGLMLCKHFSFVSIIFSVLYNKAQLLAARLKAPQFFVDRDRPTMRGPCCWLEKY